MKYSGHESFSIRKNWLQKGLLNISSFQKTGKEHELETMDELGLGRNMVKSLRYWLKATGLTDDEPKKKTFGLSSLGKIIKENDPYIQENGTLCLLHYNLATNKENATSWYFLFNEFNMTEFSQEDFCRALEKWDEMNSDKKAALSSFQKDYDCIRHTYVSRFNDSSEFQEDPESNMECPLSSLRLLAQNDNGEIKKTHPLKNIIPPVILYALILKIREEINESAKEVKLSSLLNETKSPGKIFNLDSVLLMSLLSELENKNYLQIVRTAGLDVVRLKKEMSFEDCIKEYYGEFEND